jgi:NAD(P)H-hydrate epimerase
MSDNALLTVEEMARADAFAVAAGVASLDLMERAGEAVARLLMERWPKQPVAVLCGPGNNGGDGFVAARHLLAAGWPAKVHLLGSRDALKGDAAANAQRFQGEVVPLATDALAGVGLAVDALFGAGLARPLEGSARQAIDAVNERRLACVAVDIPSGVHGDTGQVLGAAPRSALTVTFFRPKPGHFLMPGRELAGELAVADIGIPAAALSEIRPRAHLNGPELWLDFFPWPKPAGNKYSRGHALVVGGTEMTGAARLAAQAARRIGAGLVTIAAAPYVVPVYAAGAPGVIVAAVRDDGAFRRLLGDPRKNAVLVGPGAGVTAGTRRRTLAALASGKAAVLDADAISAFEGEAEKLFEAIRGPCLMTPHEGEFGRLFKLAGDKLSRARAAAEASRAVVLLKGPDTVIAAPGGRAVIDAHGPPDLATAGAGDVLAGLALGLLAQGVDPFDAASAAAWVQGEAARAFGPGLIAEDLPEGVPAVLRRLREWSRRAP